MSLEDADWMRKSWAMHSLKEMVLSSDSRPARSLGSIEEVQTVSMVA